MTPQERAALNGFIPGSNAPWSRGESYDPEPLEDTKGLRWLLFIILASAVGFAAAIRFVFL